MFCAVRAACSLQNLTSTPKDLVVGVDFRYYQEYNVNVMVSLRLTIFCTKASETRA